MPRQWSSVLLPLLIASSASAVSMNWTFDQAGNVLEWTEEVPFSGTRVLRSEYWATTWQYFFASELRVVGEPEYYSGVAGFRLAMIPEPSTGLLVIAGLLGVSGWRRRAVSRTCARC
jgi:hypothetical protein